MEEGKAQPGWPAQPHTSEDEEGTGLRTCCSAARTPRHGHTALLSRVLSRGSPVPSPKVKLSARERPGRCPGAPSRNPAIILEDEGSKRFTCIEKERSRGGKGDFITEICQRDSLIMSFIFLSNTSH